MNNFKQLLKQLEVKDNQLVKWGDARYFFISEFIEMLENKRTKSKSKVIDDLIENLEVMI